MPVLPIGDKIRRGKDSSVGRTEIGVPSSFSISRFVPRQDGEKLAPTRLQDDIAPGFDILIVRYEPVACRRIGAKFENAPSRPWR
jgi:hypothetical protein